VAFATLTRSRKKASGLEFNIRAFQSTKSQVSSMKWAPVFLRGKGGSVSVSAGMAAKTIRVASGVAARSQGTLLSIRQNVHPNARRTGLRKGMYVNQENSNRRGGIGVE
jgi:hypothetical protein